MKKMLLALATTTVATTAVVQAESVTGFYLGANAGLAQTNADYRINNPGVAATSAYSQKINAGKSAGLFGLFGGYGMTFAGCGYFGGELSFGFDTSKLVPIDNTDGDKTLSVSLKTKVSRNNYYGAAIRLGSLFTPQNLAYIKVGAEGGKWNFRSENLQAAAPTAGGDKVVNKSKSGVGLVLGAGLETHLKNNVFIRAEYSWLRGPTLKVEQNTAAGFGRLCSSAKISQHRLMIGAGYKF